MFHTLSVELWHIIISHLGPWDALQLREVNKHMCLIVTNNQPYWYRQFCWYLILQKKRPAMFKTGCKKTHNHIRNIDCINVDQELQLASILNVHVSQLSQIIVNNPNTLDLISINCENASHYVYDLPNDRMSIPLDPLDYDPKEQIYCYRFLIHNYRQQKYKIAKYDIKEVMQQQQNIQKELKRKKQEWQKIQQSYTRDIEKIENREKYLKTISQQIKQVNTNKIFHAQRSRTYRGIIDEKFLKNTSF